MSNILLLADIQVSINDIEKCAAFIQEHAPNIDIADTIRQTRGHSPTLRELKAFVQSQNRLESRCQDNDVVSQMHIEVMHRIVIKQFCFDAVNLGSYLTHDIDRYDAFRYVTIAYAFGTPSLRNYDDLPARNPYTNEQLTLSQLRRLNMQLELILKAHEWVVRHNLRTDPRTLY